MSKLSSAFLWVQQSVSGNDRSIKLFKLKSYGKTVWRWLDGCRSIPLTVASVLSFFSVNSLLFPICFTNNCSSAFHIWWSWTSCFCIGQPKRCERIHRQNSRGDKWSTTWLKEASKYNNHWSWYLEFCIIHLGYRFFLFHRPVLSKIMLTLLCSAYQAILSWSYSNEPHVLSHSLNLPPLVAGGMQYGKA